MKVWSVKRFLLEAEILTQKPHNAGRPRNCPDRLCKVVGAAWVSRALLTRERVGSRTAGAA